MVSRKISLILVGLVVLWACNHEITPGQLSEGPQMRNDLTVTGTVALASGVKTKGKGTLFVVARAQNQVGGPPLAVVSLQNPVLPIGFTMSQKSVMIPTNVFSGKIRLSAKWSQSGSPMAVMPGDLATADDVIVDVGSQGVDLVLVDSVVE